MTQVSSNMQPRPRSIRASFLRDVPTKQAGSTRSNSHPYRARKKKNNRNAKTAATDGRPVLPGSAAPSSPPVRDPKPVMKPVSTVSVCMNSVTAHFASPPSSENMLSPIARESPVTTVFALRKELFNDFAPVAHISGEQFLELCCPSAASITTGHRQRLVLGDSANVPSIGYSGITKDTLASIESRSHPTHPQTARPVQEQAAALSLNPKAADFVPREDSEALRLFWESAGLWHPQSLQLSYDLSDSLDVQRTSWIERSILNPDSSFFSSPTGI